jgi:cell wall assembly regulator SMI1
MSGTEGLTMTHQENLKSLLSSIDKWLAENRPDYYAQLQKGASEKELTDLETQFNIKLPESFKVLYKWRNGQENRCFASIFGNYQFMSLQWIVSTKESLDGMIGTDFEDPEWWKREWLPFLDNGGGDYICLDAIGRIIKFWHEEEDREIIHANFDEWLIMLCLSMENGSYQVS